MTEWTKIKPTEVGWYWWRSRAEVAPEVVFLQGDGRIIATGDWQDPQRHGNAGEWWPEPVAPPSSIESPALLRDALGTIASTDGGHMGDIARAALRKARQ